MSLQTTTHRLFHRAAPMRTFSSSAGRRKALQNWKRPSIDDLLVPTEPWARVHARNQKKFNILIDIFIMSTQRDLHFRLQVTLQWQRAV